MFSDIKTNATHNLYELRKYLLEIKDKEVGFISNDFIDTTKGLYFVYAYGIFEETIRKTVMRTIECLNQSNVTVLSCKEELLQLILSGEYDGLYNVGNEKKWEKRWNISNRLKHNEIVTIPTDLMPTDGKNVRYKQLDSIAKAFGMEMPIIPRPEVGGYISEMVDNRNHIAHGNEIPQDIGRKYTSNDLMKRYDAINEFCTYFVEIYEKYIVDEKYLK